MPGTQQRKRHPEAVPQTDGFPRHPGWNTVGMGRRSLTRGQGKAGSVGFDNVFRLGLGIILGFGLAKQIIFGMPEELHWTTGVASVRRYSRVDQIWLERPPLDQNRVRLPIVHQLA